MRGLVNGIAFVAVCVLAVAVVLVVGSAFGTAMHNLMLWVTA